HSKISLDRCQRQTAFPNQTFEDVGQAVIFKVIENRIVVRNAGNPAALMGLPQIAHKSAARKAGIHLEGCGEDCVTEGQARSAASLSHWFLNARAEIAQ